MSNEHRDNRPAATFLDMADSGGDTQTFPTDPESDGVGGEALLAAGAQLGRYVITETLGKGGMGVVYKAVDPELGRWVAIKLVRVRASSRSRRESLEDARARLLREAQALAKLKHPNVVTVHDVGRFEDDIFIAMEFVEGTTLRRWLEDERRSVADIVRVMSGAGAGLAAAHAAGLVHRDFKPANLMIGADERVWVLDFGLVRTNELDAGVSSLFSGSTLDSFSDGEGFSASTDISGFDVQDSFDYSEALTRQGAVVGTPAYMAPEQYAGSAVDQRTDLFSFCVVLYEALYGVRPFRSKRVERLRKDIRTGAFAEPPADRQVPGWLEAIWRRGLAPDPDDRYPSMHVLLAELGRDRQRQRRRWLALLGVLALMVMAAVAGALLWQSEPAPVLCQGAREQLAEVWDEQRRAATEKAFLATGRTYALDTFERLDRVIKRYTDDWADMHTRACRATRVTGEQSEALLDMRMRCLDRQRAKLTALTSLFARDADADVLDNSIKTASALPDIATCADLEALTAQAPLPDAPKARTAIARLRLRIDGLQSAHASGDFKTGVEAARAILAEARVIDYPPASAEAAVELGIMKYLAGDHRGSETILREAARDTAIARDDRLFAIIQLRLLGLVGERTALGPEAELVRWGAENAVARAGSPPRLRAQLDAQLGDIAWRQSHYQQAISRHEQALTVRREQLGDNDSLSVAESYWSLARIYWEQGENDQARTYIQRALDIYQRVLGPEHPDVGKLWSNIGTTLVGEQQYSEARSYLERALEITQNALGAEHPDVAALLNNLGDVLGQTEQFEQATRYFERARTVLTRVHGAEHPNVGICWQNLAEMSRRQARYTQSLPLYDRAHGIFLTALGTEHPFLAYPLTSKGLALIELGQIDQARSLLTRALALRTANQGAETELARTRFALARALWPNSRRALAAGERTRAGQLAEQALSAFLSAGAPFADEVSEIRAWRDERQL